MTEALAVGLVGAGPWAQMTHAPMLAAGPETALVGIWARRPEAADALARRHGCRAYSDYGELLASCDAMAFAVPPAVQAQMALRAARAGKHLLLDKPVAASLQDAERLADAVGEADVMSLVLLTMRFSAPVRDFLAAAVEAGPLAASYESISDAFLQGPFSNSPWRHEGGVLPDVGPHVVDLLTALLGSAERAEVQSSGGLVRLSLRHAGGAFSTAILGAHYTGPPVHALRAYTPGQVLHCDVTAADPDLWSRARVTFTEAVRTRVPHPCDVHRGVELQRVLAAATT